MVAKHYEKSLFSTIYLKYVYYMITSTSLIIIAIILYFEFFVSGSIDQRIETFVTLVL
jgi:hypothetical protein